MPRSNQQDGIFRLEVSGVAKDVHQNFPISFNYSASGTAYLAGCRVISTRQLENGSKIENRIEIRAFRDTAEDLASLADGDFVHLRGELGKKKGKDDKWYDVLTVDEVIAHIPR